MKTFNFGVVIVPKGETIEQALGRWNAPPIAFSIDNNPQLPTDVPANVQQEVLFAQGRQSRRRA